MEATAVVEPGRANPRQLWIRRQNVESFARLVEEIHESARKALGPEHCPVLVLQLTHSGRYSRPGRAPAPVIAHHSPYLDPIHKLSADYPLITDDELEKLEEDYVEAAVCAQRAGFDAVDVKACHRYLISELHASHTRDGRYGGSFENRSRFMRNIVARIRDAVPGLIVSSRMNAYDAMAYPYGFGVDPDDAARADLREPQQLVRYLQTAGAPLVNITIGNPYYNPYVNRPFDLPVAGGSIPPESPLAGVARFVDIVRRIQRDSPRMAVVGGGYTWLRQFFPHVAAAAVRQKAVTLVGVGRMAFAYPEFARDLAEHGRLDVDRVCVACSACTQIMRDGGRAGCVPRDAAVYEPIYKAGRAEALDTILAMAATCRQCNDPTCIRHCPAQVNIPEFVAHIAAGRFRAAYETLRKSNVLAAVCGYVCPAETLCEIGCINEHYTSSVPIRHLQRWVSRKAVEEGWSAEPRPGGPPSGRRVAVAGAGPAGVSAAAALAGSGHEVVLFDGNPYEGGTARETIPAQRLPEAIIETETRDILKSSGRITRRVQRLDSTFTVDDILAEGFDAVLLALGLSRSIKLPMAAHPRTGVTGALDFLRDARKGASVTGTVLVLGGGNTAIDAALSASRAGASDVSIVYRRSFAEMPAWPEERDLAIRSGVHFLILTATLGYATDAEGRLTGVRVARTRLGAAGVDGRRVPEIIEGSEHILPADLAIEAIGQEIAPDLKEALAGVRLTGRGLVWTQDSTLQTSRAGVFAAGDIVNGGTTVVQAVAEGARAAREIDSYLAGVGTETKQESEIR
jgi:NADPH-dependent glutamate synthase beta subunit-like oxidoreductase/2,4-dienoyl-CoA reductase-like NADH-dependent reductase (Old Yellow Enzyme family)